MSAIYWQINDPTRVWNAVTSILIVACPCALLLSATFTNGNMLRVLQNFGFFARNAGVIEQIAAADTIVFDKTGTITEQTNSEIKYEGTPLDEQIAQYVRSLAAQSNHPLSKAIVSYLPSYKKLVVKNYHEEPGAGIVGMIENNKVAIGSLNFFNPNAVQIDVGTKVYVQIKDRVYGYFAIQTNYRQGLAHVLGKLKERFKVSLISGDNDSEYSKLKNLFNAKQYFNRSPQDKLEYIEKLQKENKKVIMIGDGLNDAGALRQSNVGIAVTDNVNNFSPACDVIFDGTKFSHLDDLLKYCTHNKLIINISFSVSIFYNVVGLYFAVQGNLQPVIAAILMPVSSMSIVLLTTGLSTVLALPIKRKYKLRGRLFLKLI